MPIDKYAAMAARSARIETSNVGMLKTTLEHGGDLVKCSEISPTCPLCAKYQGRVYSVSGKDKRFPSLFDTAFRNGYAMIHPNCRHEFFPYIEEMETQEQVKQDVKDSNRTWDESSRLNQSEAEREAYTKAQKQLRQFNSELVEFKKMRTYYAQRHSPPPYTTLGAFRRARRSEAEGYKELHDLLLTYKRNDDKIKAFKDDLVNGRINLKLRAQKQREHIAGTKERERRKEQDAKNKIPSSEFFENIDIKMLSEKYKGTGTLVFGINRKLPVEYIEADTFIGQVWSDKQQAFVKTKRFAIVYSKAGLHMYPVEERKNESRNDFKSPKNG